MSKWWAYVSGMFNVPVGSWAGFVLFWGSDVIGRLIPSYVIIAFPPTDLIGRMEISEKVSWAFQSELHGALAFCYNSCEAGRVGQRHRAICWRVAGAPWSLLRSVWLHVNWLMTCRQSGLLAKPQFMETRFLHRSESGRFLFLTADSSPLNRMENISFVRMAVRD